MKFEVADEIGRPSAFFEAYANRIRETADIGRTLDLACGRGRHALAALELGLDVLALDRNAESLATLEARARSQTGPGSGTLTTLRADLESPAPAPTRSDAASKRPADRLPGPLPDLPEASFGAVLVFRYLHRPLMPWIESLVAVSGILLYETFTTNQRQLGWGPRRDEFLLRPGELPTLVSELEIEVYEEGPSADEPSALTARMLARRRE